LEHSAISADISFPLSRVAACCIGVHHLTMLVPQSRSRRIALKAPTCDAFVFPMLTTVGSVDNILYKSNASILELIAVISLAVICFRIYIFVDNLYFKKGEKMLGLLNRKNYSIEGFPIVFNSFKGKTFSVWSLRKYHNHFSPSVKIWWCYNIYIYADVGIIYIYTIEM